MDSESPKLDWWKISINFSLPLFILFLNLIIVAPLFLGEYSRFDSSQPIYLRAFQFFNQGWPHILWANFWQAGFSFSSVFSPLLFVLIKIITFLGLPPAGVFRILSGLGYAIIPVCLYFFVNILSKRKIAAFVAALAFSLLPSLKILLFSGIKEISVKFTYAPWLFIENSLGNLPHILSFCLVLLAGTYFLYTLKHANLKKIVICSLLIALAVLFDFLSFFCVLILLFVLMFSEVLLSDKIAQSRLGIFLICLIIAFGLFSFWYNPSFFYNFFANGQGMKTGQDLLNIIPYLILIVPWLIIIIFYFFGYRRHLQSLFVGFGWFSLSFLICFAFYFFNKSLVPEVERYVVTMNMALAIVLGVLVTHFFDWLGRVGAAKYRLANFFRYLFVLGLVCLISYYAWPFLRNSWSYNLAQQNIQQAKIYKISEWFKNNVNPNGSRVFLTENDKNWFSVFSSQFQESGPLKENQLENNLIYAINNYFEQGNDPETTMILAQATNTAYFVVSDQFLNTERLEKIGQKVFEIDNYKIFKISLKNEGLVQKIKLSEFSALNQIKQDLNNEDIKSYLTWQKELAETKIDYQFLNSQRIEIKSDLAENEGLLVKINYDKSFKAKEGDNNLKIEKDPWGFMVIKPNKTGQQVIALEYGLSLGRLLGFDITILTIFFLIIYGVRNRRRRVIK